MSIPSGRKNQRRGSIGDLAILPIVQRGARTSYLKRVFVFRIVAMMYFLLRLSKRVISSTTLETKVLQHGVEGRSTGEGREGVVGGFDEPPAPPKDRGHGYDRLGEPVRVAAASVSFAC
jgi:hypothetical protein